MFHNEALQTLDMIVAAAVEEPPRTAPPASPALGACYIVAASPTGAWAGKAQCAAAYTSGGWRFVAPLEGMTTFVRSTGLWATFRASGWELGTVHGTSVVLGGQQVVGSQAGPIAAPSGGTTVDTQVRTTIGQILAALRQHGLIGT